jgi:DNA (cytosine-5)-methyltransferase 1
MAATVTDLFCGAGGSSLGAEGAGATLRLAANHWRLAVETHAANFPGADHDCADVSQVDPRRYPATDVLLASPECTTHSLSASRRRHEPNLFDPGGDPATERSRATMWDVPRFAEFHRYRAVVVENVVEVRRWAPYQAWLESMRLLGYAHREVFLNSLVAHPTPQSRDRLYVVFWRAGARAPELELTAAAWCPVCRGDVSARQVWKDPARPAGKYRQQYLYRCPACRGVAWPYAWPAASAIDWSLPAPRIGERVRPLAPATLRRVRLGLERFGMAPVGDGPPSHERQERSLPALLPGGEAPGSVAADGNHHALVVPVHHGSAGPGAQPAALPWPTQTGRQEHALVVPLRANAHPVPAASCPVPAVCASGNHHGLVVPYRGRATATTTAEPLPTQDTRDRFALVIKHFSGGAEMAHGPTEPFGTVTTAGQQGVVEADSLPVTVEECGFRMLEPEEIQAAMAFPASYAVAGCKRDRVRQLGNAVTPPAMALLVSRVLEALT